MTTFDVDNPATDPDDQEVMFGPLGPQTEAETLRATLLDSSFALSLARPPPLFSWDEFVRRLRFGLQFPSTRSLWWVIRDRVLSESLKLTHVYSERAEAIRRGELPSP